MTRNVVKMLIIDDDIENRRLLRRGLSKKDYRVVEAETGDAGLDLLRSKQPDIVILELVLPDIDGIEVISLIRAHSKVPVIVLSSCGDERTKVKALLSGADDYVTKPFSMDEFVARLQTGLRHAFHQQGQEQIFRSGKLIVDLVRRKVTFAGEDVKLSPTEFNLLRLLVTHAGCVLTHRQIMRELRGESAEHDVQYLRVYVRLLRRKIEPDPARPRYIRTEPWSAPLGPDR